MRRLIPDSLTGRAVLVLVLGLGLSHVVSMAVHYGDPAHRMALFEFHHRAERMIAIAGILAPAPAERRAELAAAMADPEISIALTRTAPARSGTETWPARLVMASLIHALPEATTARVEIVGAQPADQLVMTLPLDRDSGWLVLASVAGGLEPGLVGRLALELLIMTLGVVVLAVWAARRLMAPLASFAVAAERFSKDIAAPLIDESGPREIRQAARAFNNMQRRLRRLVEDRTLMLGAVSHDLRTPITRMRLRAEFLDDDSKAKILRDLEEMERMTDAALAFARDQSASEPLQQTDLTFMVESVCNDLVDSGFRVSFSGGARGPFRCRPWAIRRALNNLIANAVKYGGDAEVALSEDNNAILITVRDHGGGLSEDQMERVFEPFYRADKARSQAAGAGLGLTVARSVIRGHGGEVTLANAAGGGLVATIRLPR